MPEPSPSWSPAQRWGFRWAALYFALYSATSLSLEFLPISEMLQPLLLWIARNVLGLEGPFTTVPNGSGDTALEYVTVLLYLVLATIGCIVWSSLDRRSAHPRLAIALHIWARYWLAFFMLSYGVSKLFGGQFPPPDVLRLSSTYGDSSPMGLLWTFMGASQVYCAFTGGVEFVAGMLLVWRRTTTLGAVISVVAMTQIVLLNFCYDVPVKLFSSHLLAVALALMALDGRRLLAVFVLDGAVPARAEVVMRPSLRARRIAAVLFLVVAAGLPTFSLLQWKAATSSQPEPLYGLYDVVSDELDGRPIDEALRWRQIAFGRWNRVAMYPLHGPRERNQVELDPETSTFVLSPEDGPDQTWSYTQGEDEQLILIGEIDGKQRRVTLRRNDVEPLLTSRGFHWFNERPYNR